MVGLYFGDDIMARTSWVNLFSIAWPKLSTGRYVYWSTRDVCAMSDTGATLVELLAWRMTLLMNLRKMKPSA